MGPSDDELYDASREMQDAIWAMVDETGMDDDMGASAARLRHANTLTSLSLERIEAEYDRVSEVEIKIAHSEDVKEEFAATKHLLTDWRGMAAEEFGRKLENLKSHIDYFGPVSGKLTYYVGGFGSLAVHNRQSLWDVCKRTTAGALQVIDDQDAREEELMIASGNAIIQKVLDFEPGKVGRLALGALVDLAAATATYAVKGHNGPRVISNYLTAADFLERSFIEGLDQLVIKMRSESGRIAHHFRFADVYQPMASYVDIESPDFSYDKFASTSHEPDPGFDSTVEKQREKMVAEQKARDTDITRRLGGAV